jgi:hypothetical protein
LGRQIVQLLAVLGSGAYSEYVSIHKARKMGKVPAKRISTGIRKATPQRIRKEENYGIRNISQANSDIWSQHDSGAILKLLAYADIYESI